MKRFSVVVFETVCPLFSDRTIAKGGGVCFFEDGSSADPAGIVARIASEHLIWDVGRCLQIGVATLDERLLDVSCHKFAEGIYWQGGDEA